MIKLTVNLFSYQFMNLKSYDVYINFKYGSTKIRKYGVDIKKSKYLKLYETNL